MKILIAGSNEAWALESNYSKALLEVGVDVIEVPVQTMFYNYYRRNIINKTLFKTGFSLIERKIEKKLREVVLQTKPDIVWVFKGMEIKPETLRWIKKQGIKLVNFNPDNPFIFSGKGSGNKNVTRSIGLYDLHFTYDKYVKERIETEYKITCELLPFGYEVSDSLYKECAQQQEIVKVCFLGNPDEHRAKILNALANHIDIDIYGGNWNKFIHQPRISVFPPIYEREFWKTLYRYRVQLNLMRPHNPNTHNMRSFEVPGVGGIGLFQRTPDHACFFAENKEVFLFNTVDECLQKALFLLNMAASDAGKIRVAAREKSLKAGYSYRSRAMQALVEMKKLVA